MLVQASMVQTEAAFAGGSLAFALLRGIWQPVLPLSPLSVVGRMLFNGLLSRRARHVFAMLYSFLSVICAPMIARRSRLGRIPVQHASDAPMAACSWDLNGKILGMRLQHAAGASTRLPESWNI